MQGKDTYALVIGINVYAHEKTQNLEAAFQDADRFQKFLSGTLGVPEGNIISLRDGQATRQGILDGFRELENIAGKYDKNPEVKAPGTAGGKAEGAAGGEGKHTVGDAVGGKAENAVESKAGDKPQELRLGPSMIIFFAGHGARSTKPEGWGEWAPDSTHVEMLCPSDIGMPLTGTGEPEGDGGKGKPAWGEDENPRSVDESDVDRERVAGAKVVEGIPDRTVCWLLNGLSERRGNNIVSSPSLSGSKHNSHRPGRL